MAIAFFDYLVVMRQHLLDNPTLATEKCAVFLHLPTEADYPYITLSWDKTHEVAGRGTGLVSLGIWSVASGGEELEKLRSAVRQALEKPRCLMGETYTHDVFVRIMDEKRSPDILGPHALHVHYQAVLRPRRLTFGTTT